MLLLVVVADGLEGLAEILGEIVVDGGGLGVAVGEVRSEESLGAGWDGGWGELLGRGLTQVDDLETFKVGSGPKLKVELSILDLTPF